jgi:hypothetical protein
MVDTDSLLGATTGLLAVGLLVNVAGKAMDKFEDRKEKHKHSNKMKPNKSIW